MSTRPSIAGSRHSTHRLCYAEDFVNELRSMNATPHVAQKTNGAVRRCIRKRIEEAFGRIKTVAGQDKIRFRGRDRVGCSLPPPII
jgi:hypothetical protein